MREGRAVLQVITLFTTSHPSARLGLSAVGISSYCSSMGAASFPGTRRFIAHARNRQPTVMLIGHEPFRIQPTGSSTLNITAMKQASLPPITIIPRRHNRTNFISEFMKSVNRQVEENKDFQQNVKLLSDKTTEIAESDTMKRAREAMAKGAQGTSKVVEGITHVASKVGEGVGQVLESTPVKKTVEVVGKVGETVQKVAVDPLLETEAAKKIAKTVETVQKDLQSDIGARYMEHQTQEERDRIKKERAAAAASSANVPNPDAGGAVVVVEETKFAKSWRSFMDNNPISLGLSSVGKKIEESENPIVERIRDSWWRISSALTDETEEARAIRAFRTVDPKFRKEEFLAEATRFIIPEILEAHLKGDLLTIKEWCSEKVYAELSASVAHQKQAGLVSDCKLLDLKNVDIKVIKFLETGEVPFLQMTLSTQEVLLFRDRKTGEIKLGSESQVENANYGVFFTKSNFVDENASYNPTTNNWKVIAWVRASGGW